MVLLMTSKHVLIIPSWYPEKVSDVGGSFFREQAIALRKRGYKVGVIAPMFRSIRDVKGIATKKYGTEYQKDEGVDTYRYHTLNLPKLPRFARFRWINIGLKLYKKYIKKHGIPDVIHVHSMLNGGFLAYEIKRIFDVPYIITEHSTAFARDLISRPVLEALKPVVDHSSYNIAVSNEFAKLLSEKLDVQSWQYIPNIVNDDFLLHEFNHLEDNFKFINICLLDKKKKVDVLIQSFARSFKGCENISLVIGGDGPEKIYLESLARDLGIQKQVCFLGMLTREQVKLEVAKSNVFVLSSEYETFGVVVVEALALGKPVVATKCGGPESIVTEEVGYLVDVNNIEQMAQAMKDLYQNINQFIPDEIRKYCIDKFSEDAVVDKLSKVYRKVLTNNEK